MFSKNIFFKNFKIKKLKNKNKINQDLISIINENSELIKSFSKNYKDNFNNKFIKKYKKFRIIKIIGIGGSCLGSKAIYNFLKHKIKKKFIFLDNLNFYKKENYNDKLLNIVISKSGNTIETIINTNLYVKKNDSNIFLTENKLNYLSSLAKKLKSEIIHHNNFIGGRYSVLSEVGMLPAELMGLNSSHFRQFNNLIKCKKFMRDLVINVSSTLYLLKKKKFNSVIINYDENSKDFLYWYQQLLAESLGKNKMGILPIISSMPKDNHSVMQLFLDGFENSFYTFFFVKENNSKKLKNEFLLTEKPYLKNKTLDEIKFAQKIATENIFRNKNIPFRSIEIKKRSEKVLGELFCFFMLETILLGRALKVNPYDQPSVELIKNETNRILLKKITKNNF